MSDVTYSDYNKPSKQIALDLIYQATGYEVPENKIEFGLPEVLDPRPEDDTDENTFVPAKVSPLEDGRLSYDGNGFAYRRLNINEIVPDTGIDTFPLTYPFYIHDMLPSINSFLGTVLTEEDVINDYYDHEAPTVLLRAHPYSLAWIGQRILALGTGRFLVRQTILPGFKTFNPLTDEPGDGKPYNGSSLSRLTALINQVSAFHLVYGVDFTLGDMVPVNGRGYNTKIRIIPVDPSYAAQDIYYTRLSIAEMGNLPTGFVKQVDLAVIPFSTQALLADINTALGLQLTSAEIYNDTYGTREEAYTLHVRGLNSLAWTTSKFDFNVRHILSPRYLEDGSTFRLLETNERRTLEEPL